MEVIKIEGGRPLNGTVRIDSAKNSTVALIPAAILADSSVILEGVPQIVDVEHLGMMIEQLNGTYKLFKLVINPKKLYKKTKEKLDAIVSTLESNEVNNKQISNLDEAKNRLIKELNELEQYKNMEELVMAKQVPSIIYTAY
mgnify:CR=1 FL=1